MSICPHQDQLTRLQPPRLSQSVHREECTQCFDNQDSPDGIDVCLSCFNGGCLDSDRHHAYTHVHKTTHPFTLNVKRRPKPSAQRASGEEPPAKITKIAIAKDREEDSFEHITATKCWLCDPDHGREIAHVPNTLVDGVMQSMSSARKSEVEAWEEEFLPCEHTLTLHQFDATHIPASGLAHCSACDLKENLWLCMTCGSLGCGRHQFGGLSGNGHGLAHYQQTGHAVSVKLGTITPEGNADIYCYVCNDAKLDPDLAKHLATFGINVNTLSKTEKSMTELQIEHNLNYDFSLTADDGTAFEPLFGPGLTGFSNLGNSCYIASVLQTLFSLPAFKSRYGTSAHSHSCTVPLPADCVECQMHKIADGLLTGRYAHPAKYASGSPQPAFQAGIKPTSFKALIGKGHGEFSTMRQQDAEEFFAHLLTVLRRDAHKNKVAEQDATAIFSYAMQQRLQCNDCKRVRYRVDKMDAVSFAVPAVQNGDKYEEVQLVQCLDALLGTEALEYSCPACNKLVHALKQTRFASFPDVLVVHAKKFQLVNWVPSKLDIPVILPPTDVLEFGEKHLGRGLQDSEVALPEDVPAPTPVKFNEAAMAQLEGMGFPLVRCQKALLATGNADPEAAMEWLFAHMEDPDIDEPIQAAATAVASGPEPSPEQVAMLSDMGFTPAQARKALRETSGNAERAVEWLFNHPDDTGEDASASTPAAAPPTATASADIPGSTAVPARYKLKAFVSHKGPSAHSGHYVAHIRGEDGAWVLFNDEKVVKADEESVGVYKKLAYLYFFEKV